MPQSNQRGIETKQRAGQRLRVPLGLNRTSVGLKPHAPAAGGPAGEGPQSNQRGIETMDADHLSVLNPQGLNRTSVGLKLRRRA